MTVVLVHGNPETDAIWGPLVDALGRDDVVRLSPPGFGAPLPDDFPATYLDYRDWLERELERFDQPVDLVGHDWGGGHVVNVAMHRPELLRTWASDVVGLFDAEYVWHDLAQVWQTPGTGEQLVDTMLGGTVEDRAAQLAGLGLPRDIATSVAAAQAPRWGGRSCSCTDRPHSRFSPRPDAASKRPLPGRACPFSPRRIRTWGLMTCVGGRRGRPARAPEVFQGLGHWWMVQDPARERRGAHAILGDRRLTDRICHTPVA